MNWCPAPPAEDRAAWQAVHSDAIVDAAQRAAKEPWPKLTATEYLRFRRDGDRVGYETPYFDRRGRLATAVLAAAMTGRDDLLAAVVDGVWLLCEESTWCIPAHERSPLPDPRRPVLDLFAAETGGLLAYTDAVLGARLDAAAPGLRARLRAELHTRVLAPYNEREEWWYAGTATSPVNNWNPWIHSNVLPVALLLDETVIEASPKSLLLLGGRIDHGTVGERVCAGLGNFIAACPADGGCDEGVAYWWRAGGSLFECLELLGAGFDVPKLARIARYPLVAHVAGDWQVNFADGPAVPKPGGADPALLYRLGRAVGDPEVVAHALAMPPAPEVPRSPATSLGRVLRGLFDEDWRAARRGDYPYVGQEWLPDTEVLSARERPGSAGGLFLAAKGGHNFENHNHNDVGTFIVALDGTPVLVDAGVGRYSGKTFSDRRYEIWTMRSAYHNVPEVDGHEQPDGAAYRAGDVHCDLTDRSVELRLELASAYPLNAGIRSWRRVMRLERGGPARVLVEDAWELAGPPAAGLALRLMAAAGVEVAAPGELRAGGLAIGYDAGAFTPSVEAIPLDDDELARVWGPALHRVTLFAPRAPAAGVHRLIVQAIL